MQFYVLKDNQQQGPFTLMDVRDKLQKGEFAYTDLAWREGLANWTPLKDLLGGALPDATPHAVAPWATPAPVAPAQAPFAARILTAIVLFVVLFFVLFVITFIVCCIIGGAIAGAQAVAVQHAPRRAAGSRRRPRGRPRLRRDYGAVIMLGSALFSLVLSPIIAGLMAFSNLFPWCRAK